MSKQATVIENTEPIIVELRCQTPIPISDLTRALDRTFLRCYSRLHPDGTVRLTLVFAPPPDPVLVHPKDPNP